MNASVLTAGQAPAIAGAAEKFNLIRAQSRFGRPRFRFRRRRTAVDAANLADYKERQLAVGAILPPLFFERCRLEAQMVWL